MATTERERVTLPAMPPDASLQRAVRKNTALLATSTAVTSATLQLVAALASTTFVLATGYEGSGRRSFSRARRWPRSRRGA
jgi:hypothetical protein